MFNVFYLLSVLLNVYAFVCVIRIALTWFPKANYSPAGKVLASICDPFLNLFRRIRFLNFRGLDFSPALAICILYAAGTLLSGLAHAQTISVGNILAMVLGLTWSLVSSVANFFIVILIIRLIAYFIIKRASRNHYGSYSPFWDSFDRMISPFVFKVSGFFSKKPISFSSSLIISIIFSLVFVMLSRIIVSFLINLLGALPF